MLCDVLKASQSIKNLFSIQLRLLYLLTKDILALNVNKLLEHLLYAIFVLKGHILLLL